MSEEEISGEDGQEESRYSNTEEALEDGTLLRIYKEMYLKDRNEETLWTLMSCMKDSNGILAVEVEELSEKEKARLKESESAQDMDIDMGNRMTPELLQSDSGQAWMPVFTSFDQVPDAYIEGHQFVAGRIVDCIAVAHQYADMIDGVLFDPFTEPFEMPFSVADEVENMPSIRDAIAQYEASLAEGGDAEEGNAADGATAEDAATGTDSSPSPTDDPVSGEN